MKFFQNPKIYKFRYGIIITCVIVLVLFWDLLLKAITDGYDVMIIPNFFWFSSTHNTGAAYSLFSGHTTALVVVTSVLIALILVYNWFKKQKSIFYSVSIGLILGGAIGNLIDRIFLGYVRDFIRMSLFSFCCNLADVCLTVGVILFLIYIIFFDEKIVVVKPKQKKEESKNINDSYSEKDGKYKEE